MSHEDKSNYIYNEISNDKTNFALNKFLFQFNAYGDCLSLVQGIVENVVIQVSSIMGWNQNDIIIYELPEAHTLIVFRLFHIYV